MTDKSYVTMEENLCPVCGAAHDTGALLFNKRLQKTFERKTVTGWSLCPKCTALDAQGYIALVGIRNEYPVDKLDLEQTDRSGHIVHIRREKWPELHFDVPLPSTKMVFVDERIIKQLMEIAIEH